MPLLLPGGQRRMSGLTVAGEARDWELHRHRGARFFLLDSAFPVKGIAFFVLDSLGSLHEGEDKMVCDQRLQVSDLR